MDISRPRILKSLHIFMLVNLAIAPLYELTAKYADFFVAHDSRALDLFLLVFILSILVPGIVVILLNFARLISSTLEEILHTVTVGFLLLIIALPLGKKVIGEALSSPDLFIISAAIVFATLLTALYVRSKIFRTILGYTSPMIIVIPILFLFFSPIRSIIFSNTLKDPVAIEADEFKGEIPIVMVILDELPLISLLDKGGLIDSEHFPNFSELANNSHWFRNATTVSATTNYSVPAILSGKFPDGEIRLPNLNDYPETLLTLLQGNYDFNVLECCTQLSPVESETSLKGGFTKRFSLLTSDLYLIYLHILAPPGLSNKLTPINLTWEGFAPTEDKGEEATKKSLEHLFQLPHFINTLSGFNGRTLNLIHTVFPHYPWTFYPSGVTYGGYGTGVIGIIGLDKNQWWTDDEWPVIQAYQHHLLQVAYADKLIGRLMKKLKDEGLYEKSLIVVVADHGASFRPGDHFRSLTKTNYMDIMTVPLFIKEPFQKKGQINDRNVETIDILPTIADVLGVRIPWSTNGDSMLDPSIPERETKVIFNGAWVEGEFYKPYLFALENFTPYDARGERFTLFADGFYKFGMDKELLGRQVSEFPGGGTSKFRIDKSSKDLQTEAGSEQGHLALGLIAGRVLNTEGRSEPVRLAASINGKIEAITRTLEPEGDVAGFSFLIPEEAFGQEAARVEIFEISGTDENVVLRRTANTTYVLRKEGTREVIAVNDESLGLIRRIPVDHNAMLGRVEDITIEDGGVQVEFTGWAADTIRKELPGEILVFVKGKYLSSAVTKYKSPKESEFRGAPEKSGFNFSIPIQVINSPGTSLADIRIFAVSRNDKAIELNYFYTNRASRLRIERTPSGNEVIAISPGERIPVTKGALKGEITSMDDSGETITLSGWAIDMENGLYPEVILLFVDGKLISKVKTSYYGPGEAGAQAGIKGPIKSGFIFKIPKELLPTTQDIRIFAFSRSGATSELEYLETER